VIRHRKRFVAVRNANVKFYKIVNSYNSYVTQFLQSHSLSANEKLTMTLEEVVAKRLREILDHLFVRAYVRVCVCTLCVCVCVCVCVSR
jgi:hypothetical protein